MSVYSGLEFLHPVFRSSIEHLLFLVKQHSLPFKLFETFRSPGRQAYLFALGREPGTGHRIFTRAKPWQSFHQFGLAADLVIFENRKFTWREGPEWRELHRLARSLGLEPLSFERPHVQPTDLIVDQFYLGHYPFGGDSLWADNLNGEIQGWGQSLPKAPPVVVLP